MANHRMFSNRIANSAKFLQMPEGAQLLYFHMVQRADDDGIVESYPIIKLLGTAPDNLRILLAKAFIKQLNEDQVVVIPDWLEHNTIRADRKVDSIYKPLLIATYPEIKLIEAKPRTDVKDNSRRVDSPRSAEGKVSKDKISNTSKVRTLPVTIVQITDEDKEIKPKTKPKYPNARTAFGWFPKVEPSWLLNTTELKHGELLFLRGEKQVKAALRYVSEHKDEEYFPTVTKPSDLERKWRDIVAKHNK